MILTPPSGMLSRGQAIQDALSRMMPAGSGFNTSLMSVAGGLYYTAVPEAEGLELARGRAVSLGVPESRQWEIERAFARAYRGGNSRSNSTSHRGGGGDSDGAIAELKRVPKDVERVEALAEAGLKEKLSASSLIKPVDTWPTIRTIYPDRRTLLCVGMAQDDGWVVLRDSCLELSRCSFIVPNPMTAYSGLNQDGEISCRTLANTGPRVFLVLDFDFSRYDRSGTIKTVWYDAIERCSARGITPQDMCAGAIGALSAASGPGPRLPLSMVVDTGGKSLHPWYWSAGLSDAELWDFMRLAVSLGADPVTWVRCQWVRMPGGVRNESGSLRRQPVIYFNPAVVD